MAHTVVAAIEQLRTLNVFALQKKYQQIFGDASKSSNKQYLFRRIAWRLQANAEGGLNAGRSETKARACPCSPVARRAAETPRRAAA